MAWWKRETKSQPREVKVSLGSSSGWGSFFQAGELGVLTPSSALKLYEQSTAVSIPINMVVDLFADIEPILKINDEPVADHPLLDLLQNPSPYFTRAQFFEAIGKDYEITGNTYIVALGNTAMPPLELQPISPRNVQVTQGQSGLPSQYTVGGDSLNGAYAREDTKTGVAFVNGPVLDMKQIRMYSTKSNSLLEGQSKLLSASREAKQHILGSEHNVSLLENGGRLSLVFYLSADMDEETFADAERRILAKYGGSSNAGDIGVVAGGDGAMDIKEFGVNAKDMDFVNLQMMAKHAVAQQYKVPLPLVSIEANTFNNYAEANLALWDGAVIPLIRKVFAGLSDWLLPKYKLDPSKDMISFDPDQITALQMRRNREMKIRTEIGVESDNEIRALMSLEDYQGGDQHLKPANLIPVGSEGLLPPKEGDL